ncbi:MAG TPA: metal ABC transporter substrate-binding protein [Jiangellaceae bacterium]
MNLRTRALLLPLAAATGLTLAACGSDGAGASSDGPTVVTSFYPLAFVAERVAGDHARIENLTQAGAEPHDLELAARQVGQIVDADLVVFLHGFQPSVDAAIEQNAEGSALDAGELVELIPEGTEDEDHADEPAGDSHEGHDHGDLEGDPHIWLDPANMVAITEAVAGRLAELDPDHADDFQANADALVADLEAVDAEYEAGLAQCERRVFITSHAAFGYLAHRYDLDQVGISGIDPDAEPSPERLAEVHDVVAHEGVTTIFYERLVSPKVAETLASDLGVEAAVLDPIEGLTDDTSDQDYLTLMRANLAALAQASGCS